MLCKLCLAEYAARITAPVPGRASRPEVRERPRVRRAAHPDERGLPAGQARLSGARRSEAELARPTLPAGTGTLRPCSRAGGLGVPAGPAALTACPRTSRRFATEPVDVSMSTDASALGPRSAGGLDLPAACHSTIQPVCDAVPYHAECCLLGLADQVKLIDFGVAKYIGGTLARSCVHRPSPPTLPTVSTTSSV